ncbi:MULTISPECIES: hypothetical protein [Halorussus]|uniref:hypothetical protein n=1 Tax=Halorussus TaxID=1070314 RepID=UPI0020A0989C|nr:hypothetical protein [Halorussus vallis]USZ74045.1 hypothetical protein NGM07_11315 [Halorussus vallis]
MVSTNYNFREALTPLLGMIFFIAGVETFGIGSFSLSGFDLGATLSTAGGQSITLAPFVGLGMLVGGYALNDRDFSDFSDVQSYVAYTTFGIVGLTGLVPALGTIVTGSLALGWFLHFVTIVGFAFIAGYQP